jgi:hypothetical protein
MTSILDSIFGKKKTPEEIGKEWRQSLRQQIREIERNVRSNYFF